MLSITIFFRIMLLDKVNLKQVHIFRLILLSLEQLNKSHLHKIHKLHIRTFY